MIHLKNRIGVDDIITKREESGMVDYVFKRVKTVIIDYIYASIKEGEKGSSLKQHP